ncbi:MAG: MarR family winged helix-turn-helix transcriptional regulator [Bacillota bacterium]
MNELQTNNPATSATYSVSERGVRFRGPDLYRGQASWFAILRAIDGAHSRALKGSSLTVQQYAAMLEIACRGGEGALTVGMLARCMGVRHNTAVYVLNRLSALRLAERINSDKDRRRVHLRLTSKGHEVLQRCAVEDLGLVTALRDALAEVSGSPL